MFELVSDYTPQGDQPQAIESLVAGLNVGKKHQTLLGVTGSGKTFTIANVIQQVQKPTLVLAHNKILAAQLCTEFKEFFPNNAVEFFVSYYDYYQPEAYIPSTDTFIEKDASINDEIDKLRHSATASLLERKDVIVVASVSCIYGLGDPDDYQNLTLYLRVGSTLDRDIAISKLIDMQYQRNDISLTRGKFRVRGDIIEIFSSNQSERAIRVEFFGDEIDKITEVDVLTGNVVNVLNFATIFPNSHYATTPDKMESAIKTIEAELEKRIKYFKDNDKPLEAQRIEQRTRYDIEMMQEIGFCQGIENYSRHISGREPGSPPFTLMDYFGDDYLLVVDESHVTIPQVGAMYNGDKARKSSLIGFGFRLPSAYDNRPLTFDEFEQRVDNAIYVSATPSSYEINKSGGEIVEQILRPTGLIDPEIEVRPIEGQIEDLYGEINKVIDNGGRVLVTTLTKKMAEDLTEYLESLGVKVRYLHSEVKTFERMEIVRDLRMGEFDVLVGINLLREGLDIPEVQLVAILDADKEGFLRSETSMIQTVGRAARNSQGRVIMYADKETGSMQRAIRETKRRRKTQLKYNEEHGITPQTIIKKVADIIETSMASTRKTPQKTRDDKRKEAIEASVASASGSVMTPQQILVEIERLTSEMQLASYNLQFEQAAKLRDRIKYLEKQVMNV
ncbi:MAG: excinuclease ABC subunit UvrB [Clostridiales bacterium]|jgi:excinuclease ABC subunit B|nr:excinuclease ABC subunit UvrB [Clostridiales bacterium]